MTLGRRMLGWVLRGIAALVLLIIAVIGGINLYIQLPAKPPIALDSQSVGYFAYGSNMNLRYFTRVRGITPAASQAARLDGYEVVFNLPGLPDLEPTFANLAPAKGQIAFGVLHQISQDDLQSVIASEGPSYRVVDVTVVLADGSTAKAKTLFSAESLKESGVPSRRYLSLLFEAAQNNEFPAAVTDGYDPDEGAYVPVLSELLGALIHTIVWLSARL
ncbi:MAG: gamma-glutamylcyclotransferase family protein [Pseudomonadota bacterium]